MSFKTDIQAQINNAYIKGYEQGIEQGKRDAILQKYTPNQIREIVGLPPIEKKDELCEVIDNGTVDKLIVSLGDVAKKTPDPVDQVIFSTLIQYAKIFKELDKRTR